MSKTLHHRNQSLSVAAVSRLLSDTLSGCPCFPTSIDIDPRATIEIAHRFELLIAIMVWVIPPASAIAFAARRPQSRGLHLGLLIAVLLFATICFFLGRQGRSASMEWVAVIASIIGLSALTLSLFRAKYIRSSTILNAAAILFLLGSSLPALSLWARKISQPKEMWSTTLQQQEWQSMNTDSEYAATRQVAFAGDRVFAVFDAGFGPSKPSGDKWPTSVYRLISLDLKTGAKIKEITIGGRWGSMPYISPTQQGFIDVQSNPLRTLDQDLVQVTGASGTGPGKLNTAREPLECGAANCNPLTYIMGGNVLQLRQKRFQVVDNSAHVLSCGNLVELGNFAGASGDGRRFAIQSSYMEGDPAFVIYEYFTVYEAATGKALAVIHTQNLPARQSWSAFSYNGRYFATGNPNRLTMYDLPSNPVTDGT